MSWPNSPWNASQVPILKKYNIKFFFYIGGNDSAETAHIVNESAKAQVRWGRTARAELRNCRDALVASVLTALPPRAARATRWRASTSRRRSTTTSASPTTGSPAFSARILLF